MFPEFSHSPIWEISYVRVRPSCRLLVETWAAVNHVGDSLEQSIEFANREVGSDKEQSHRVDRPHFQPLVGLREGFPSLQALLRGGLGKARRG
jgi:hypothetical protein